MRINKPRSFIGGQLLPNKTDSAYNLITQKELSDTQRLITEEYENILKGEQAHGVEKSYGYAYLAANGKIDPSLMPSLAISETHVIHSSDLFPNGIEEGHLSGQDRNAIKATLEQFILDQQDVQNSPYKAQKGDIFVIAPNDGETSNPNIHGSFIVVTQPGDKISENTTSSVFKVTRLSYDSGNIVKINSKTLDEDGVPGGMTLFLHDILKEKYYLETTTEQGATVIEEQEALGLTNAKVLESTVYRLNTYKDSSGVIPASDGDYRFAFRDEKKNIVPYAKLRELNEVSGIVNTKEANLYTTIGTLSGVVDSKFEFVSGTVEDISGFLGTSDQTKSTAADATIAQKTAQLRYELNNRTAALSSVHENVINLSLRLDNLSDKAIELEYVTFTWGLEDAPSAINSFDSTLVDWIYTLPSSYTNYSMTFTGAEHPVRILAIYDENNEIVYPDIEVIKETGVTKVKVQTNIPSGDTYATLAGCTWTVLVAKTIKNINVLVDETTQTVAQNLKIGQGVINTNLTAY